MSSNWIQDTCFAEKTGLSIGVLPKMESLRSVIVASEAAESAAEVHIIARCRRFKVPENR